MAASRAVVAVTSTRESGSPARITCVVERDIRLDMDRYCTRRVGLRLRLPCLTQRSECRADLRRKKHRLFPRGEVPALVHFVEVNEVVIAAFRPASRCLIDLAREDRHGSRQGNVHSVEIVGMVFPIDLRGRRSAVRQPVERNIVKHLITREHAFRFAAELKSEVVSGGIEAGD
jgi:hypothetical protein